MEAETDCGQQCLSNALNNRRPSIQVAGIIEACGQSIISFDKEARPRTTVSPRISRMICLFIGHVFKNVSKLKKKKKL